MLITAQNSISLGGPNWAGSGGTISPLFLKIRYERLSQHIALKGSIDFVNVPQVDCFAQSTIALFSKYNSLKLQFVNNFSVPFCRFERSFSEQVFVSNNIMGGIPSPTCMK